MKTCVFAGSFDPVTKGHQNIVEKAKKLYDNVLVIVGVNPDKSPLFPLELRLEMLNDIYRNDDMVKVFFWDSDSVAINFMKEHGITDYVRGIRNGRDLEYEKLGEVSKKKIYPDLNTVYITPDKDFINISSSLLKEKLAKGEDISFFVDARIIKKIENFFIKTAKK